MVDATEEVVEEGYVLEVGVFFWLFLLFLEDVVTLEQVGFHCSGSVFAELGETEGQQDEDLQEGS